MRYAERERQGGSVFIVALMVLVMLTVIGLSLALVTETEMLIGGNEQVIQETFYAAEAAVGVAVSQILVANSMDSKCLALLARDGDDQPRMLGVQNLGYSIDSTKFAPVAWDPAPWTQVNEGDDNTYYAGFLRGEGRAFRGSWLVSDDPTLDSDAITMPREPGELLEDADFTIQAEKTIELAFYSAPLEKLESGTLVDSHLFPNVFGCEPEPELNIITAPGPAP